MRNLKMRKRCESLRRQGFRFETRMTAPRDPNETFAEHWHARDSCWRIAEVQDRHVNLLAVEGADHKVAIEGQHPEVNRWRDFPQMLDQRQKDGGDVKVDSCDRKGACLAGIEDGRDEH